MLVGPEHLERGGGNLRRVVFFGQGFNSGEVAVKVSGSQGLAQGLLKEVPAAGGDIGGGGDAGGLDHRAGHLLDGFELTALAAFH